MVPLGRFRLATNLGGVLRVLAKIFSKNVLSWWMRPTNCPTWPTALDGGRTTGTNTGNVRFFRTTLSLRVNTVSRFSATNEVHPPIFRKTCTTCDQSLLLFVSRIKFPSDPLRSLAHTASRWVPTISPNDALSSLISLFSSALSL